MEAGGGELCGLLAGGDQGVAVRDVGQQGGDVGGRNHFQEGVGGVVLQPPDFAGGVVEGQAFAGAEVPDPRFVKAFFAHYAEMVFIPEVNEPHDSPVVVDPIRIVERHAPAMRLGRETSQEEDACARRQERLKGMRLGNHSPKLLLSPELNKFLGVGVSLLAELELVLGGGCY